MFRAPRVGFLLGVLGVVLCAACEKAPPPRAVVIGLDGVDPGVVQELWALGRLPNLKRIAERGVFMPMETNSRWSSVIWTTLATGVDSETHGIEFFTVRRPDGEVPVTSNLRRVDAVWDIASRAGRRVAVLGWWVTWPAEPVNGILVSDRILTDLDRRTFPAQLAGKLTAGPSSAARFEKDAYGFLALPAPAADGWQELPRQDHLIAEVAVDLAGQDFDLVLAYLRSVDLVSHRFWKYFRSEQFPHLRQEDVERFRDVVAKGYEAVDRAVGAIVTALPEDVAVFVVSDHGFRTLRPERVQARIDLDRVLEAVGLQERGDAGQPDPARSRLVTHASRVLAERKLVQVPPAYLSAGAGRSVAQVRDQTERLLERVRYRSDWPVFAIRDARADELELGADFVVEVRSRRASRELYFGEEVLAGAVHSLFRRSGTHDESTPGIFLAAGPGIERSRLGSRPHVSDFAPTLLYSLGLEVPKIVQGEALTGIFTEDFQADVPLRFSEGSARDRSSEVGLESSEDEELLEQLRALGYLN